MGKKYITAFSSEQTHAVLGIMGTSLKDVMYFMAYLRKNDHIQVLIQLDAHKRNFELIDAFQSKLEMCPKYTDAPAPCLS